MIQVSKNLWRGGRPKDLADLQKAGFKTIIDLESGIYEALHDDKYERQNPADFGLRGVHIPCSDFFPPDYEKVSKFIAWSITSKKCYVHCLHGVDRTGYMVACYRMYIEGWSASDAVREMLKLGFHKFPYAIWIPSLWFFDRKLQEISRSEKLEGAGE
jgi:protein-tyrosine phosphatase